MHLKSVVGLVVKVTVAKVDVVLVEKNVSDTEKYQWLLKVFAILSGETAETCDKKITKAMMETSTL